MTQTKSSSVSSSAPDYVFFLAGAAIAFFFTQGLPLWDDDYSQWSRMSNELPQRVEDQKRLVSGHGRTFTVKDRVDAALHESQKLGRALGTTARGY